MEIKLLNIFDCKFISRHFSSSSHTFHSEQELAAGWVEITKDGEEEVDGQEEESSQIQFKLLNSPEQSHENQSNEGRKDVGGKEKKQ